MSEYGRLNCPACGTSAWHIATGDYNAIRISCEECPTFLVFELPDTYSLKEFKVDLGSKGREVIEARVRQEMKAKKDERFERLETQLRSLNAQMALLSQPEGKAITPDGTEEPE